MAKPPQSHAHTTVGFNLGCGACLDEHALARGFSLPPAAVGRCVHCKTNPAVLRSIEDADRQLCLDCVPLELRP